MRPLLVLLTCTVLSAPAAWAETGTAEQVRYVMGTPATVTAWAPGQAEADGAVEAAYHVFSRVDSLMSTWRDDSVLSRLNAAGAGNWVTVGSEVCEVLLEAKAVAGASGGAFDPTVLPLVRLWGFRDGAVAVPDTASLTTVMESVGHRWLEVDLQGGRARLNRAGMAVDLGGIAKGYALDQAAAAMRKAGAEGGMLDLGGNLLAFGQGPAATAGIVDPEDPSLVVATVPLVDVSAATSGQYERFLTSEGRKYGHILDPRTGHPVPGDLSVTVLAAEAQLADALATAGVVLGLEAGLALIEDIPGAEGVFAVPRPEGGYDLVATSGLAPSETNR